MQHQNLTNVAVSKQLLENVEMKPGDIVNIQTLHQPSPIGNVIHFQIK